MNPARSLCDILATYHPLVNAIASKFKFSLKFFGFLFIALSFCDGWCDEPLTVRVGAYENRPKI